jgi:HD-like signal output (HDOD) protein
MSNEPAAALDTFPLPRRAETLLDRALEIGSASPSTQELLSLTRNDEADLAAVVEALSLQPSLAAAVLRAANSPAYGQTRAVGDLQRAVLVIGMQELHDVVAGSAMLAAFSRPHPFSDQLQARAVLAATIARQLATKISAGASSSAYLSGLLAELGALACFAVDPGYADLHARVGSTLKARCDAELSRYGTTTPALGGRILSASALPEEVSEAAGASGLEPEPSVSRLARVVAFSRCAALTLLPALARDQPDELQIDLTVLSEQVGLRDVEPGLLRHVCLEAARSAGHALPAKLSAVYASPSHEPPPTPPTPVARSRTPLYVGVVVLALACAALLFGLLGR